MTSMKVSIFLSVCLVFIKCVFSHSNDPIDMSTWKFDDILRDHENAIIKVHTNWCSACKKIAPEFSKLPSLVADSHKSKVVFGKIDAENSAFLMDKFKITSVPSFFHLKKGFSSPIQLNPGNLNSAEDLAKYLSTETDIHFNVVASRQEASNPGNVRLLKSHDFDSQVEGKCALVKFQAPWCGHCKTLAPIYESLSKAFVHEPKVLISEVDCTESKDLGERYNIAGYPTIKLFNNLSTPYTKEYNEPRTLDVLLNFVNMNCGTKRLANGFLMSSVGRDAKLDSLASQFMKTASLETRESLADETRKYLGELPDKAHAKYYVTVMERVIKLGNGYVEKELGRLKKILNSSSMDSSKIDDFVVRINILEVFHGIAAPLSLESTSESNDLSPEGMIDDFDFDESFHGEYL